MSSRKLVLQAQSRETGLGVNVVADKWAHSWLFNVLCQPCVFLFLPSRNSRGPRRAELFSPWLFTSQEKQFQTGEACNFNTFYCLWPFVSPICFLSLKQGKVMATTNLLVKGPQWRCWFGFSWVIWPAIFREMQINFLHFGYVVARFQEQLMIHHCTPSCLMTSDLWAACRFWEFLCALPPPQKYSLSLIQLLQWVDLICSRCPKI